ncbi:MAG: DUF542 domain-containing protein [Dehalococcoidia bacterium]|nr:DUF542 domain-containing protein [Dehalococcoidia bacterium]
MEGPITKDSIVENIIKGYPKALGLLVSKGIDCCCGAYNTLEKGAAEAGVDLVALLWDLNAVAAQPNAAAAKKGR